MRSCITMLDRRDLSPLPRSLNTASRSRSRMERYRFFCTVVMLT